jgi:hypothetical protein
MNVSELGLWEQTKLLVMIEMWVVTVWVCCPTNQNAHEKYLYFSKEVVMEVRKIVSSLFVVFFFFLPAVSFGVTMTIGDVVGLQGDSVSTTVSGGYTLYQMWNTGGWLVNEDGVLNLRIDMGQVKTIEGLIYTNRINAASNSVAKSAGILIAADESDPGFNPNALASYTISITGGIEQLINPVANTMAIERELVPEEIYSRRYMILQVYENFYCRLDNYSNTNRSLVQCGDLALLPEPVTMALLGLGGLFLRCRKY